jgi:hypothetical protein
MALLAACDASTTRFADLPAAPGAHALLIGQIEGRAPVEVRAIDLDDALAPPIELGPFKKLDTLELEALAFTETLRQMRLARGRVALDPGPDTAPLDARTALGFRRVFTGTSAGAWSPAAPSPGWANVPVPRPPSSCAKWSPTQLELPVNETATGLITLSSTLALLVAPAHAYLVSTSSITPLSVEIPGTLNALASTERGELWIASSGQLYRGQIDLPARRLSGAPVAALSEVFVRIAAHATAAGGVEVYLLAQSGPLVRWDGSALKTLYTFPSALNDPYWGGGIAAIGDGSAMVVSLAGTGAVRVEGGVASEEMLPLSHGQPLAAVQSPSFGTAVATTGGEIFQNDGAGWKQLPVEHGLYIFSLAADGDALAYGGAGGGIQVYATGPGDCTVGNDAETPYFMTVVGSAIVADGTTSRDGSYVYWFTPSN